MDRLVDLIKVYDNDLEDDVCDYLVYHFEKSFNRHKKTLRNRTPNFTEYNLSRNAWRDKKSKKYMIYWLIKSTLDQKITLSILMIILIISFQKIEFIQTQYFQNPIILRE